MRRGFGSVGTQHNSVAYMVLLLCLLKHTGMVLVLGGISAVTCDVVLEVPGQEGQRWARYIMDEVVECTNMETMYGEDDGEMVDMEDE